MAKLYVWPILTVVALQSTASAAKGQDTIQPLLNPASSKWPKLSFLYFLKIQLCFLGISWNQVGSRAVQYYHCIMHILLVKFQRKDLSFALGSNIYLKMVFYHSSWDMDPQTTLLNISLHHIFSLHISYPLLSFSPCIYTICITSTHINVY